MASSKKSKRVSPKDFKFDPMALEEAVKGVPANGGDRLGSLHDIKRAVDVWCARNWAPALDADMDLAVERVYRNLRKLARATRDLESSGDLEKL